MLFQCRYRQGPVATFEDDVNTADDESFQCRYRQGPVATNTGETTEVKLTKFQCRYRQGPVATAIDTLADIDFTSFNAVTGKVPLQHTVPRSPCGDWTQSVLFQLL